MPMKGITLRGLEVFEALALSGSVAQASERTGISQPAVSQQLRNLETAIGANLVDHSRRPMRLTPAGTVFLARAKAALAQLRLAQNEMTVMDLAHVEALGIGIIDDFDDNLTPRLATILADSLTGCRFKMITSTSNDLVEDIKEGRLQIAIAASAGKPIPGAVEYPLARDPFMIVAPRGVEVTLKMMSDPGSLPFLRYEETQHISKLIEAQFIRHDIRMPDRFQIGSHLALMAMVARGLGWTITTPLGYMRAHRFHDNVTASALPFDAFDRRISLYASADWAEDVPRNVAQTMRRLIQSHMVDPALADLPFLEGSLSILSSGDEGSM